MNINTIRQLIVLACRSKICTEKFTNYIGSQMLRDKQRNWEKLYEKGNRYVECGFELVSVINF